MYVSVWSPSQAVLFVEQKKNPGDWRGSTTHVRRGRLFLALVSPRTFCCSGGGIHGDQVPHHDRRGQLRLWLFARGDFFCFCGLFGACCLTPLPARFGVVCVWPYLGEETAHMHPVGCVRHTEDYSGNIPYGEYLYTCCVYSSAILMTDMSIH